MSPIDSNIDTSADGDDTASASGCIPPLPNVTDGVRSWLNAAKGRRRQRCLVDGVQAPWDEAVWFAVPIISTVSINTTAKTVLCVANQLRVGLIFQYSGQPPISGYTANSLPFPTTFTGNVNLATGVITNGVITSQYGLSFIQSLAQSLCVIAPVVNVGKASPTTAPYQGFTLMYGSNPLSITQAEYGPLSSYQWVGFSHPNSPGSFASYVTTIEIVLAAWPSCEGNDSA
jgi:hypothetical protein